MAPVYLLTPLFGCPSPAEKRRYVFLSHAINPIRVGKSLPSTQSIYTHTHTLFRSFFLLMVRSFSRVRPAIFVDNQKTRSQQTNLTHNVHTHTHTEPFFSIPISPPL